MGQFPMKITPPTGSVLRENQYTRRRCTALHDDHAWLWIRRGNVKVARRSNSLICLVGENVRFAVQRTAIYASARWNAGIIIACYYYSNFCFVCGLVTAPRLDRNRG